MQVPAQPVRQPRRCADFSARIRLLVAAGLLAPASLGAQSAAPGQSSQAPDPHAMGQGNVPEHHRPGGEARGFGTGIGGGRGVLGTVTEVTPEHYTIKTDAGHSLVVHYSVNTRIVKQLAGRGPGAGQAGRRNASRDEEDGERVPPQALKPTDIKVGDIITAGGEMDEAGKSLGAVFVAVIDPERAKQMRQMEADFGKTWLGGRILAIDGTTITIDGMVDHVKHAIEVDENTSFRNRRDSITLADIQPGEQLRADGSVQGGVFRATVITAMEPRSRPQWSGDQNGVSSPAGQTAQPSQAPPN